MNSVLVPTHFPNGELKDLKVVPESTTLHWKWEGDQDITRLYLGKKANPFLKHLFIAYMPYSRADRNADGGSDCFLRHIGEMIQSLQFEQITVVDPHSDLTLAYLGPRAKSFYPFNFDMPIFNFLRDDMIEDDDVVLLFPDAGAYKRYAGMPQFKKYQHICGFKHRDFQTGKITGYAVPNAEVVKGKQVIIVDDLCSFGGTFVLAAKELRKSKPTRITVMVSHCENNVLDGDFWDCGAIDHLVTTDSIYEHGSTTNTHVLAL